MDDGLDTKKGPYDFKNKNDYQEYCFCVARHILKEICIICPRNYRNTKSEKTEKEIKKAISD